MFILFQFGFLRIFQGDDVAPNTTISIYGRSHSCGPTILDLKREYNIYGKCTIYILIVVKLLVHLLEKFLYSWKVKNVKAHNILFIDWTDTSIEKSVPSETFSPEMTVGSLFNDLLIKSLIISLWFSE